MGNDLFLGISFEKVPRNKQTVFPLRKNRIDERFFFDYITSYEKTSFIFAAYPFFGFTFLFFFRLIEHIRVHEQRIVERRKLILVYRKWLIKRAIFP